MHLKLSNHLAYTTMHTNHLTYNNTPLCKLTKTITRECLDKGHSIEKYPQYCQPVYETEPAVESEPDYEGYDLGDLGTSSIHAEPEPDYEGYDLGDLGLSTACDAETQDFTRMLWYVTECVDAPCIY